MTGRAPARIRRNNRAERLQPKIIYLIIIDIARANNLSHYPLLPQTLLDLPI
jgi:hypothetical protein